MLLILPSFALKPKLSDKLLGRFQVQDEELRDIYLNINSLEQRSKTYWRFNYDVYDEDQEDILSYEQNGQILGDVLLFHHSDNGESFYHSIDVNARNVRRGILDGVKTNLPLSTEDSPLKNTILLETMRKRD